MTSEELVSPHHSPGPKQLFGTDLGSWKGWRSDEDVVNNAAPLVMEFSVASSLWVWTHNLGFRPTVAAYTTSWEQFEVNVLHNSTAELQVEHLSNLAGYLVIR